MMKVIYLLYAFFWVIPRRLKFTRVGTLIVATIYLQLIQNRYSKMSL